MIHAQRFEISLPVSNNFRIAIVSDIHATANYPAIIYQLELNNPDVIFIPGDLCHYSDDCRIPLKFLNEAVRIAPVYYSFGNHERNTDESVFNNIPGVHLLNDKYESFGDVIIGGLRSGFRGQVESAVMETPVPDLDFLSDFESLSGVKLLLCHHPEYYPKYLKKTNVDLIFSGHAHGGQWRIFGRGIFAPGQGLFPKYTSGLYDNRLIVSPGVANTVIIPRLFNPCTIMVIDITSK